MLHTPPQHSSGDEDNSPCSQYGYLVLEGTGSCYHGTVFVYFDLSEGSLKEWHKVPAFLLPNLQFSKGRKETMQRAFLKNIERQMDKLLSPGIKDYSWGKQ